jgi:hypothetical protein
MYRTVIVVYIAAYRDPGEEICRVLGMYGNCSFFSYIRRRGSRDEETTAAFMRRERY